MEVELTTTTTMPSAAAPVTSSQLPPGFRFHPTDDELILHYLRNRAASLPCPVPIIADVDIYKFDPWDLPCKAVYGDGEWYFFSPRDRKYPNGIRPNRAAGSGYWKATGTDKPIHDAATGESVGVKKALVFYKGRPPKGTKTNWIMHEYRLAGAGDPPAAGAAFRPTPVKFRNVSMRLDDWVLCRIYKKSGQASPMVPPLADYDHLDQDERYSSGGGGDDICSSSSSFYAPTSTATTTTTANCSVTTTTTNNQQHAAAAARLPNLPSFSDLFDDYALAQIFDTAAVPPDADQHAPFAMHPSLNQLLAIGDGDDSSDLMTYNDSSYYYPAAGGSTVGVAKKRKVCPPAAEFVHADAGNPPAAARRLLHASCFDAPPPPASSGFLPATSSEQVLGGLSTMNHNNNNNMLPHSN